MCLCSVCGLLLEVFSSSVREIREGYDLTFSPFTFLVNCRCSLVIFVEFFVNLSQFCGLILRIWRSVYLHVYVLQCFIVYYVGICGSVGMYVIVVRLVSTICFLLHDSI